MKKMTLQDRTELMIRMDERQKAMADNIELIYTEVKRTNGRVTRLETWQSKVGGIWYALAIGAPIIGAIIGYVVQAIFH